MAINNLRLKSIFDKFGLPPMYDEQNSGEEPPLESMGYVPMLRQNTGNSMLNVGDLPSGQKPQNPDAAAYFRNEMTANTPQPTTPKNWLEILNEQYHPQTAASERFDKFIDEYPQRQEPGLGSKISAGLAGLGNIRMNQPGGPLEAEKVLNAPHVRDVADWKTRAEPMYQSANLERQGNIQERQLIGQGAQAENAAERNRIQEKKVDDQREIGLIRANAYRAKQMKAEIVIDKGSGQVIAKHLDGHVEYLGKVPGSSTAAELADIEGKWDVAAAGARGEAAVKTAQAGAQATGRDLIVVDGITYQRTPEGGFTPSDLPKGTPTRPGTPGSGSGAATNFVKDRNQTLQRLADERPEYLSLGFLEPPKTANDSWKIGAIPTKSMMERQQTFDARMAKFNEMRQILGLSPIGGTQQQKTPSAQPKKESSTQGLGPTEVPAPNVYNTPQAKREDIKSVTTQEPWILGMGKKVYGAATEKPSQAAPNVYTGTQGIQDQQERARVFLQQNKIPVTQANIEHAIRTGRVQ
jgi:hypothetical protein